MASSHPEPAETPESAPHPSEAARPPSLVLRRPHLHDLPPLVLPEGFTLRTRQSEADLEQIAEVLAAAFPEMVWNREKVREALVDDASVKTTFVIASVQSGRIIACASARSQPERYPNAGYVHWVAAHPDHRGRKLGYFASLATLHEFARWGCETAVLHTDDFRPPAIRVYLSLGFTPEMSDPSHPERWKALGFGH